MWTTPPSLHQSYYATGLPEFIVDTGPVILISIGSTLSPVLGYFFILEPYLQSRRKRHWLALNREAIRRHFILQYLLASLAAKLPPCTNCGRLEPQFWDHGRNLLVFRCPHCELNKTLTAFQFAEVALVLENLTGLYVVLNRLRTDTSDQLGKHLWAQSSNVHLFFRKHLRRSRGV